MSEDIAKLIDPRLAPSSAALAEAVIDLVAHGDFIRAVALLRSHTETRETATLLAFQAWHDLPLRERPPFWEWRPRFCRSDPTSSNAEVSR